MHPLIECVMNFSEGRDRKTVDRIAEAIRGTSKVRVLDCHMDEAHHRSVITFAGSPDAVEEAAVRGAASAAELIDLRRHQGEHPRIGAADVIPFIPILDVTMEECIGIARHAGQRIASELGIPVYLYGAAAEREERRDLSEIRRGGFEGLSREIATVASRAPDFGDSRIHPTAGASAVGARDFLIAFNVYLKTEDAAVARDIARAVRRSSGGLQALKALGLQIPLRRQVQVSMNLTDYRTTSLEQAFAAVAKEAAARGVEVAGSEIVGLIPRAALPSVPDEALRLETPSRTLILEQRLTETGLWGPAK